MDDAGLMSGFGEFASSAEVTLLPDGGTMQGDGHRVHVEQIRGSGVDVSHRPFSITTPV